MLSALLPPKMEKGPKSAPKFFSDSFQFLAELRVLQPPLCIKKPLCEAVLRVLAGSCTQKSTPFHIFSFFMKTHTQEALRTFFAGSEVSRLRPLLCAARTPFRASGRGCQAIAVGDHFAKVLRRDTGVHLHGVPVGMVHMPARRNGGVGRPPEIGFHWFTFQIYAYNHVDDHRFCSCYIYEP